MEKEDAQAEHDDADDGEGQQRRSRGISRRSEPPDQADVRYDHYPLPEPEIDELFLDAIELGHGAPGALCSRCEDTSKPNPAPSVTAPSTWW